MVHKSGLKWVRLPGIPFEVVKLLFCEAWRLFAANRYSAAAAFVS